jgi:hypothetical protein
LSGFTGQNKPVLAAIVAIVATCVDVAQKGMAELPNRRLTAGVTMGGGRPQRRATGGAWMREQRFMVNFSYRVAGAESAAEDGLADAVDLFTDAIITGPTLGGLVINAEVDNSLADNPEYSIWTNQERRIYPVLVTVTQSAQIPI